MSFKHLNTVREKPILNVEFKNISYTVSDNNVKNGRRKILHSINGKFCSGELTAIMGPSGAGKSTLLNILAGYVTSKVDGKIKINNSFREMATFKKLSCYITQEDIIQPCLTVKEAMTFAARLKLGSHITHERKLSVIEEVINLLGLEDCTDTFSEHLSGGQRKRLTIALELVNNPPVIFLDEPTTGLDNFAVKQCIDLLKKISQLGRTVICTIHQPPASLFQYFNQIYVMADGYCVYNGSPNHLVPFLTRLGFTCPSNNTPADYIIELVHSQSVLINDFKEATQNGNINMTDVKNKAPLEEVLLKSSDINFSSSFQEQLLALILRRILQMKRNKMGLYLQILHHLSAGILIGMLFNGIGNDATQILALAKYCLGCNVFFLYTYVMLPVLLFPFEVDLLSREYFNHWYSLRAYYLAMTIVNFVLFIILGSVFSTIVYFMADQPQEMHRFLGFCLISFALGLTSQGLGYLIGSFCSATIGGILASSVLALLLTSGTYGFGYKANLDSFVDFILNLSYERHALVGLCNALFYRRGPLTCNEDYCHYTNPEFFMRDMGMDATDYKCQLGYLFIFMVFFRVTGYFILKLRIKNYEMVSKIVYLANRLLKFKRI